MGIKSKQNEILNHWISSADNFSLPPSEFYEAVEKKLKDIQVPGLELSREEFAEGGILSGNRVYLRMMRERLAFDICAAPFGTRYFFSCRTSYVPAVVKIWHIVVVLGLLLAVHYGLTQYFANPVASIVLVAGLVLAVALMLRNVAIMGLSDVDAMLLKTPALGPIYERVFRKDSYYRQDTRLMYLDTVPAVIQALAEDVTGAKGVKLVRQYQRAPILGELYKPVPPRAAEPIP